MSFPSLLLLSPHTCLSWILRACFVRVFLFCVLFLYHSMGVSHLMGCSSGDRLPMITVAFVNGDTHQAFPPLPQQFVHLCNIQQSMLLRAGMMFWCNGSLWASCGGIWMEFNDMGYTRSH